MNSFEDMSITELLRLREKVDAALARHTQLPPAKIAAALSAKPLSKSVN